MAAGSVTAAPLRERRAWSLIASTWLHLALLIVARCPIERPAHAGHAGEQRFELALVDSAPSGASRDAVEDEAPSDAAATQASAGDQGADPTSAERAAKAAQSEAAEARARATDATLEQRTRDPARPEAPERRETEKAEIAEPEPPPPDPLAQAELPEVDPRVEREEEEEEEPEKEDASEISEGRGDRFQKYVRVTDDQALGGPAQDSDYIGARDAWAERMRRAAVTAEEQGLLTPQQEGESRAPAAPSLDVDGGAEVSSKGATAVASERADATQAGGGGGRSGSALGSGAPSAGGDRTEGGSAAPQGGGMTAPPPAASGGGAGAMAGMPEAPDGTEPIASVTPSWWQPTAFRVVLSSSAPAPTTQDVQEASPTDAVARALVETPGERADRGGTDLVEDEEALVDAAEDPVESPTAAEEAGEADVVDDLREALGWGDVERDKLKPRPSTELPLTAEGSKASSSQAVIDQTYDLSAVAFVSASGTPLGRYTEGMYRILQERWYKLDLDPHSRALGIQGQVTLLFRVHENGRVSDVVVEKTSGHPAIDALAKTALPTKLPRFPNDLEDEAVVQRVTFRYRNPLVSAGSGR